MDDLLNSLKKAEDYGYLTHDEATVLLKKQLGLLPADTPKTDEATAPTEAVSAEPAQQ